MATAGKIDSTNEAPSFGFILIGGALVGSAIRDIRIANELAERGFDVHIFWAIDRTPVLQLHPSIKEHWIFNAARYNGIVMNMLRMKISPPDDYFGMFLSWITPLKFRLWLYQNGVGRFDIVRWAMNGMIRHVCRGVETDPGQLKRFARIINREKITHLVPNISVFGPFCAAVKQYVKHPLKYLLTYQGYEVYANYARDKGREAVLYERLKETAEEADYRAVVVSEDYAERVQRDIGLTRDQIAIVPACVTLSEIMDATLARETISRVLPGYDPELPLLTYIGRQDSEKGIDLLLYAAKILESRGKQFQLALCGTTAWGEFYKQACHRIADNLRLPILKAGFLSEEEMRAIYRGSHAIVYPSIHREPFGMVPVESMAQGTPVVVPNAGGVAELPFADDLQAGYTFRIWETADLADRLAKLLDDPEEYAMLSENARPIAEQYSAETITTQMLELMDLPDAPNSIRTMTQVDKTREEAFESIERSA